MAADKKDLQVVLDHMYYALRSSSYFYKDMRGASNPDTLRNRVFRHLGYTDSKVKEVTAPGNEMSLIRSFAEYMHDYGYFDGASADFLVRYFTSRPPLTNEESREISAEKLPDNAHYADMNENEEIPAPDEPEMSSELPPENIPLPTDEDIASMQMAVDDSSSGNFPEEEELAWDMAPSPQRTVKNTVKKEKDHGQEKPVEAKPSIDVPPEEEHEIVTEDDLVPEPKTPSVSPDKQFEIRPDDSRDTASVKNLDRDFFKDPDFLKRYSSYAALGVPDGFNDDGSIHFKSTILGGASALYILKATAEAQKKLDEKSPSFKGKIRKAREIIPPVVVELEDGLLNGLPVALKKDASIIHLPAGKAGRARDFVLLTDIDKEKAKAAGLKFPDNMKDRLETSLMKYNRREPAHFDTFMYEFSNLKKRMAGNAKDYTNTFSKALKYSDEDKKVLADFAGRQFNHAVFNKLLVPPDDKLLIDVEEKTDNGMVHKKVTGRYVDQRLVYAMEQEARKKAAEQGLSGDDADAFVSDVVKARKEKYSIHLEKEFQDIRKKANGILDMSEGYKKKIQDVMSRHPDFLLDASRLGSVYVNLYTEKKKEAGLEFDKEREYFCKQAHVDDRTLSQKLSDAASLSFDKGISQDNGFKQNTPVLVGSDVSRMRFLSTLAQTQAAGPISALEDKDKKYLMAYRTAENLRNMKGILLDRGMEDSMQFDVLRRSFEETVKSIPPETMQRIGEAVSKQAEWDKAHPSLAVADSLLDEAEKYAKFHEAEKPDKKEDKKDDEKDKSITDKDKTGKDLPNDSKKDEKISFEHTTPLHDILAKKNPKMMVSDSVLSRDPFKVSDLSSTVIPRMNTQEKMNVTSLKALLDEKVRVETSAYMYGYETQQILDTPYLEELNEKEEKITETIDRKIKSEIMLERLSSNDAQLSDDFYKERAEKYKKVEEQYARHMDQMMEEKKQKEEDIDTKLSRTAYNLRKTPEYHKPFTGEKFKKNPYKNGRSSPEYDRKKKYEQGRSKKDENKNKGMTM